MQKHQIKKITKLTNINQDDLGHTITCFIINYMSLRFVKSYMEASEEKWVNYENYYKDQDRMRFNH